MRSLILAALAASTMTTPDAEACGSYLPEPLMVTSHRIPSADGAAWTQRTFVVLDQAAPEGLRWTRVAPRSYDGTLIASAPDLDAPMQVTLVGAAGVRIVSSKHQVYLSRSWQFDGAVTALEIEGSRDDGFTFALAGRHDRASWIALDAARLAGDDDAWVRANGVIPADEASISIGRLHGTDLETVSVLPRDATAVVTFVRRGRENLGRHDGSPVGAVVERGQRRLVLSTVRGELHTSWL